MMEKAELFECDLAGDYLTWSNRHRNGLIHSRIDNFLGITTWCLQFSQCSMETLRPRISDNSPLCIDLDIPTKMRRSSFKFVNYWTDCDGYEEKVAEKWQSISVEGNPMYKPWKKLQALQPLWKEMNKNFTNTQKKLRKLELS